MYEVLLIAGMMALTFGPRYLPFALAGRIQLPPLVTQALEFVPVAVLTAIIIQATLYRDGILAINLENHYLVAALCAFATSLLTKHMFLTILVGLVTYGISLWLG
ncbi:AzlD domain-containing protein [Gynuella sp.]|uniref:AzlD domain-containing protein n=1 Tax=Gynuella sp. TaxID=2969146 RepID=UPI003D0D0354